MAAPKSATATWLNKIAKQKTTMLQEMYEMEPIHVDVKDPRTKQIKPRAQGEHLLYLWDKIYGDDPVMKGIVVDTVTGPSTPDKDYCDDTTANPVYPYQKLRALVGDGGKWKWPEIWKQLDLLPRRGPAWRHIDDPSNLGKMENPNPDIVPLRCLVVGGGPVGLRLAIELALGGHRVTLWEVRREIIDEATGMFESVGFTNRVNRPHINNFCRNDLDRLNGRNFMTAKMCYPVFTNAHTSSIGIDECQMLLMKSALLLGVDFRLGVGLSGAEVDIENETNQRPSWMVDYFCDDMAQKRYGMEDAGSQRFDALFGCDGGRSKVRETQSEWLGKPKSRKYKKMFGIVSNLRKVSKKKLQELGYDRGLEPEDRAGQGTGIFFYRASYHNYFIVHPDTAEMEAEGIPWKGIFTFDKAGGEVNQEKTDLKANLKRFITKKAKELGIPIDETLENDGFVSAPNDVMGFDFTEFYNCEKSAACFVPPLDWNADEDGEWEIHCPLVALCGDAVADPNWLLGVGLRRGWTSAMDACYFADNVYNNKSFNGQPPDVEKPMTEPVEWLEHLDNIMNLMQKLGNASRDGKLSAEMDTGMLDEKGPVVSQIKKGFKGLDHEAPVPPYQIPVDPYYRYKEFDIAVRKNYRGEKINTVIHPWVVRELAIYEQNKKFVDEGIFIKTKVTRPMGPMLTWPKRFSCSAFWGMMKLLEIDGKSAPGEKPVNTSGRSSSPIEHKQEKVLPPKINVEEITTRARRKSVSLRENLVVAAMQGTTDNDTQNNNAGIQSLLNRFNSPKKEYGADGEILKSVSETNGHGEDAPTPLPPTPRPVGRLTPMQLRKPTPSSTPNTVTRSGSGSSNGNGNGSIISNDDMDIIKRLSVKLDQAGPSMGVGSTVDASMVRDLNLQRVKLEKDVLKSKLAYAEAEVKKVQYEREAVDAKLTYVETEANAVRVLLSAYEDTESALNGS